MRGAINSVLADDHDEHAIAVDILVLGVAGIRHLKSQGCVKTWDACINQLLQRLIALSAHSGDGTLLCLGHTGHCAWMD